MTREIMQFVARRWSVPSDLVDVRVERVHGGLESVVARATVAAPARALVPHQLVVKQLTLRSRREAGIYELLWRHLPQPPAVRCLGVQSVGEHEYLYLEDVHDEEPWPWADTRLAAAVCAQLARLHDASELPRDAFTWDYGAELADSALETLELAGRALRADGTRCWRRMGDLRRVVNGLAAIRERLVATGTAVIHGDVHPGNVLLQRATGHVRVALIDWSRARLGSPLEDVASWLHSLGCWEPQARRRHDTLLRAYLSARRTSRALTPELRAEYALACASNGLAGAIRYHLAVAADRASSDAARRESSIALQAWERVIRRASALLSTSRAG